MSAGDRRNTDQPPVRRSHSRGTHSRREAAAPALALLRVAGRLPGTATAGGGSSRQRWQATAWSGADRLQVLTSARRMMASAKSQRGWKGQPGGQLVALEQAPQYDAADRFGVLDPRDRGDQAAGIGMARLARKDRRSARSRPYRPAYMTPTRSAICASTPRS